MAAHMTAYSKTESRRNIISRVLILALQTRKGAARRPPLSARGGNTQLKLEVELQSQLDRAMTRCPESLAEVCIITQAGQIRIARRKRPQRVVEEVVAGEAEL